MLQGTLKKMITEYKNPINYFLKMDKGFVHLNQHIGKKLNISHIGSECLSCSKELEIFRQGFCKSCFYENPATGDWVMRPELSKAHLNKADRDLEYEKKVQLQPHIIYLALSSHLKVGVTRKTQIPTRWIDQGAHEAMTIIEVPNRYLAGIGEVALKEYFSDKTNWRKMLQNEITPVKWEEAFKKSIECLPKELEPYKGTMQSLEKIFFPVQYYPSKVNSLNLLKSPVYEGKLIGVKAQYMLFEDQTVFNVRSNEGQRVKLSFIP